MSTCTTATSAGCRSKIEKELKLTFHPDARSLATSVDVLSIHSPLVPETYQLFNDQLLGEMRRGSYIVNTARGAIMDRDAGSLVSLDADTR